MEEKEKEYVEVMEHRALIYLPENAVAVTMMCEIYDEEKKEIVKCSKTMSISEIRDAFTRADEGYVDDDDVYVLTEEGQKAYDQLKAALK